MPGRIETLTQIAIGGWAAHPAHASYPVIVHALAQGRVVASSVADLPRADGGFGFQLRLRSPVALERLQVLIGETDEYLSAPAAPRRLLSVEDLIATRTQRRWINGGCHLDATAAGMRPETIIDLLCRDYLGHGASTVVTIASLARMRQGGGYDAIRRGFLSSTQYRNRQLYAEYAPGAIFSQAMILSVAARDFVTDRQNVNLVRVSARNLLRLEGEEFLSACYRQILRKEPDREGLVYYLQKLSSAMSKRDIVLHLASEFDAVNAGVQLVDLPVP